MIFLPSTEVMIVWFGVMSESTASVKKIHKILLLIMQDPSNGNGSQCQSMSINLFLLDWGVKSS